MVHLLTHGASDHLQTRLSRREGHFTYHRTTGAGMEDTVMSASLVYLGSGEPRHGLHGGRGVHHPRVTTNQPTDQRQSDQPPS